jgi:hypothetical protein
MAFAATTDPRPGHRLLAGAVAVHLLPGLPPMLSLALAAIALILLPAHEPWPTWFASVLRTLACASLDRQLPVDLHGRDFEVIGQVRGLPEVQEGSTRFEFVIESATLDGEAIALQ